MCKTRTGIGRANIPSKKLTVSQLFYIVKICKICYTVAMIANVDLQTKLKNLPDEPGVYIMYDADGNIL